MVSLASFPNPSFVSQKPIPLDDRKKIAARKILGVWRKHLETHLARAQNYIDNPKKLTGMKKAQDGNTDVYFPSDLPSLVLKRDTKISRSKEMAAAQNLIRRHQLKHLIVPQWRLHHGFLIEQRLPIKTSEYHQIGLYLNNREAFSETIRELAEFFCRAHFSDLIEFGSHPLTSIIGNKPRYDNLPLYTTRENGIDCYFVGLIDLEHFTPQEDVSDLSSEETYERLKVLIRFFPYHLETIFNVGKRYCKEIEELREDFSLLQEMSYKFIGTLYQDYLKFLHKKNITCNNPNKMFEINKQRRDELLEILSEKLEGEFANKKLPIIQAFSQSNFREKMDCLKSALPSVLDAIVKYVKKDAPRSKLNTESDLLLYRSLYSNRRDLLKLVGAILMKSLIEARFSKSELFDAHCAIHDSASIHDILVKAVFKEWVKGGEVYYFNPHDASGGFYSTVLLY